MEKYSVVVLLHFFMFLIPFVCVFGTNGNELTGNSTLVSLDLHAQSSDILNNHLVKDPSFGLSDVYSSNTGGGASNFQIISSKPIIEEISEGSLIHSNHKRNAPVRGFPEETKLRILDLHNMYRSNVTPPAGDMTFMEWDPKLEHLAQLWADGCVFDHGVPPNTSYPGGRYTQNLYLGKDPSGGNGMWLWYDEYKYYNLTTQICEPRKKCGHYVTMAWAESSKLGCGISKCENLKSRYLMVCHYFPPALIGLQMYTVAKPCSQCIDGGGSLCLSNLCMTWEQCERNPKLCAEAKCNLKCHNCGRLDKKKCKCVCADGWDSQDCSRLCSDRYAQCGVNPGFPSKKSCSLNNYAVAKKYCRKMCQTCNSYEKGKQINHICCEGKLCDNGYVLDENQCKCRLLCPGPLCDILEGSGNDVEGSINDVKLKGNDVEGSRNDVKRKGNDVERKRNDVERSGHSKNNLMLVIITILLLYHYV